MRPYLAFASFLSLLVVCALAAPARAQLASGQPVLMEAEQMGYDQANAVVVALGAVEVVQGDYVLLADRITYYQNQNQVNAEGNVSVLDPTGNVYFAEQIELTDDLKAGVINQFRARLSDNSLFAAREARKVSEDTIEMSQAVYSPCELCEDSAPFWQIKADKVVHDKARQVVEYDHARLEMFGVPVIYTPYFRHPTPDADRKSGFLTPEYSQSSNLGTVVEVPYYWNITPDKDATITPVMTSEEGLVMEGNYRQLTDNGSFEIDGSGTYPRERDALGAVTSGNNFRGHVFARGSSYLSDIWSWGFDIQRSTDDTYLRRYGYGNQDTLTSQVQLEGIDGRNFLGAYGLAFQGLEFGDDPEVMPLVMPLIDAYYETAAGWMGSNFYASGNTMALRRDLGPDTNRLSFTGGWTLPFITGGGHVFELDTSVRTDHYMVDDLLLAGTAGTRLSDENQTRVIPQAALTWRYPLIRRINDASLLVEPIVMMQARPGGSNSTLIPNEDNLVTEFTDLNLFSLNRFPGYDTVEEGSGIAYGVRSQYQFVGGQSVEALIGQHYSSDDNDAFPYNDDVNEEASDYVGRVSMDWSPVQMAYRFRLDEEDLALDRNEWQALYSGYPVTLSANYLSIEDDPLLSDVEEVAAGGAWAITDEWTITTSGRQDLLNNRSIFAGAGLVYQNECFTLFTNINRDFTRDRDLEPNTSISMRVAFKNLD